MRSSMTKLRSTKKFEIVLDSNKLKWFYMSCAAALPQLDRGSDYESERHRFESYTPHQLKLKASGNGGFSFIPPPHGFEPRSRRECLNHHFVNFSKLSLDPSRGHVHNNLCVAALPQLDRGSDYESERHRFESYTPHQLSFKPPETGAFPLRGHCGDSNLGRGASVKKTRSVFSERASPPAGGRSRCGSAQRMRGILYAAPIDFKAPGDGGFSYIAMRRRSRQALQMIKN